MKNLRFFLLNSSRGLKVGLAAFSDLISLFLASYLVLLLSDISLSSLTIMEFFRISWIPFFSIFIFYLLGLYKSVIRYIDFSFIFILFRALISALFLNCVTWLLLLLILRDDQNILFYKEITPQVWVIGFFATIFLIFSSRFFANFILSKQGSEKRVVIYGAGSAGIQLASALRVSKEFKPIAFVDNDAALHGSYVGELRIINPAKLKKFIRTKAIDEVLIAMPSASKFTLKNLLKEVEDYSVKVRILPGLAELAQGKIAVSELKEVEVTDLLGRNEIAPNKDLLFRNIKDKVVLITGSGGSIGSEISRQVVKNGPSKIILLDSNEYSLFSIKNEIRDLSAGIEVLAILANITNKERITEVCKVFKVDTVYHAAAYKHVSLVEENPFEAVYNNILGTKICAESALNSGVETFVLISTDKAVRPTNIMGATKRFAELLLQSMNKKGKTKMSIVRFGNVIGSSGSAIPLFQKQIKDGGPITVTHPEVVRYFMSIPEAAELVIQAGAMGEGGDVFVLDMGEPVKILELAKRLINLSGMELIDKDNLEGDIEIKFTGLRPGEKLFEELLIGENVSATDHKRILKAKEEFLPFDELEEYLIDLEIAEKQNDITALKNILQKAVSGFTPEKEIVDVIYRQKINN